MVFIDVYAGKESKEKQSVAKKLGIKIAPGDYSLLISKNKSEIRNKRKTTDFIAAIPKTKQEMNKLLVDTYYDFLVVDGFNIGKRNVRMAKRYETFIAVPMYPSYSLKQSNFNRIQRNLKMISDIGGDLILCSGARDSTEIRGGYELASLGVFFGLSPSTTMDSVKKTPLRILAHNKKRINSGLWKN